MNSQDSGNRVSDIVFINQNSGYLMIDLINSFVEAGYSCILIAGRIIERGNPLDPSVKVVKIIKYNRSSVFKRLFTWIVATLQICLLVKVKYRRERLFIVSNPPFAALIPLVVRNRYSILIFDVFPDALVDSELFSENSMLVKWWKKANSKVYGAADRLFTISGSMKRVLQNYTGSKDVELIPIWADSKFLKRIKPSDNTFIKKYNLQGKFVVLYSGNIGLSSQIEALVDIASLSARENIVFIFIGDGAKLKWLEQRASETSHKNIMILPWQPAKELSYSLSTANLAVVGIDKKASRLAMPSKLLSYLSVGAPILCLANEDTELAKFVTEHDVGKVFDASQSMQISRYIEWLMDNPRECERLSNKSLFASMQFNSLNAKKFL